jgi:hypothetical protein
MSNDVDTLMEMGFSQNRAKRALAKTDNSGVAAAAEWLVAHENDADIDDELVQSADKTPTGSQDSQKVETESQQPQEATRVEGEIQNAAALQAKSLKCDECGKLLRSENEVQLHASRSGHSSFSESTEEVKPLTEEERQAQLAKVQELMKQKRLEREEKEKQEQLEREKARRIHGKELTHIKQKMQEDEMKKIMDDRRREKEEEKRARQRVREQIEKDKIDRATKFGTSSTAAATGNQPATAVTTASASAAAGTTSASPPPSNQPKEYKDTNIQIRLFSGETITNRFGAAEPLAAVRLFVFNKLTAGQFKEDFVSLTFATTFPRRVFTEDEMQAPLSVLGLVPSAALMLTKAPSLL